MWQAGEGISHNNRDKDRRAEPLEEDVRQGLEDGVRDEEDGQGRVVRRLAQLEIRNEAGDLGISNIGSVEEREEVEEAELCVSKAAS